MLSDDILDKLTNVKKFIDYQGHMTFYFNSDEDAQEVSYLMNRWYFSRGKHGPWIQDGDHWDHMHNGVMFHHGEKRCKELL